MAVAEAPWIDPEVVQEGEDVLVAWRPLRVAIRFTALRESDSGKIDGEVSVLNIGDDGKRVGMFEWASISLTSLSGRESLVRSLGKRTKNFSPIDWDKAVQAACVRACEVVRQPQPLVDLGRVAVQRGKRPYLFDKMFPAGDVGMIYGDGAGGKSMTAMLLGVSYAVGRTIAGSIRPYGYGEVLYLDWESTEEDHAQRLAALSRGLSLPEPPLVSYRPMRRRLADDLAQVRTDLAQTGARLMIVDSMGLACGNVLDQEMVMRFYLALRSIPNVTKIIVTHLSAEGAKQDKGTASPVGLRWVNNYGRSNWEMRADRKDALGQLEVAMYHRKANGFPLQPPIGLRYCFEDDGDCIRVERFDVLDNATLTAHGSHSDQILGYLREAPADHNAISGALGIKSNVVRARLSTLQKSGRIEKNGSGLWKIQAAQDAP